MYIADLKVKRFTWKVYLDDPITANEELFVDGDCGSTLFLSKKIYINSRMDDELIFETIKHELTHAYLFSYGLGQVKWTEETVCDILSSLGEDILNDSKNLFKIYKEVKNEL